MHVSSSLDVAHLAGQFARRVEIHLCSGRFALARELIDLAEREMAPSASTVEAAMLPIGELFSFDTRLANRLERAGIDTAGELCGWTKAALLELSGVGFTQLAKIRSALAEHGLRLRPGARTKFRRFAQLALLQSSVSRRRRGRAAHVPTVVAPQHAR